MGQCQWEELPWEACNQDMVNLKWVGCPDNMELLKWAGCLDNMVLLKWEECLDNMEHLKWAECLDNMELHLPVAACPVKRLMECHQLAVSSSDTVKLNPLKLYHRV